ncbi:PREDICTED: B-cell differentiation antigen CD72-like, partial [Acanthisitta chloris]|uniref:B-cell differentiation antigen CD72-like n=1 Tax=Acanthisitta chloris TaxID=57068 RepID=UPI0004F0D315
MAQSVVYADLKFAAGPSSAIPDEDDSPYENVPLGPVTAAPSPGPWPRRWHIPAGLLAASLMLMLLLVVAVVALGTCYWQVTRSLQDASREHTAEQGRLSQELSVLGKMKKEMQEVQGKLNNSESTVSSLLACVNTDCCPSGWVLYRSKCLFISAQHLSWKMSYEDCARKSAQLLAPDKWRPLVPHFVQESASRYWIEAQLASDEEISLRADGRY